jgi:hypothetical protein
MPTPRRWYPCFRDATMTGRAVLDDTDRVVEEVEDAWRNP